MNQNKWETHRKKVCDRCESALLTATTTVILSILVIKKAFFKKKKKINTIWNLDNQIFWQ